MPALINFILVPKQMSSRMIFTRSQNGIVIESGSFEDQYAEEEYYQQEQSPALVMYQILFHAIMKQVSKPFQLFKQFVLFSDEDSSMDAGYKHMRRDMEVVMQNISSTYELCRKKMLITGFISIKMHFEKKVRVEHAYRNIQNLTQLVCKLKTLHRSHLRLLYWQGFGMLYQNFRGERLSKISLSKIQIMNLNNEFQSRDIDDIRPFLSSHRTNQIEHINSLIIDQNNTQQSIEIQQASENHQQEHFYEQHRRIQKKNTHKGYQINRGRLISDRSNIKGNSRIEDLERQREDNAGQLDGHFLVTDKKGMQYIDQGTTQKQRQSKELQSPEVQQIYLIRDFSKKRGPPTNFIKIPVASQNVKIIEIQTQKRKKKKRSTISERQSYYSEHQCKNCKYCAFARQRQQFMRHVKERLNSQRSNNNFVTENVVFGEFSNNGLDLRHYKPGVITSFESQLGNQYFISSDSYPREHIKIVEQTNGLDRSRKQLVVNRQYQSTNRHDQGRGETDYLSTPAYHYQNKVNKSSDYVLDNYRSGERFRQTREKTQGQKYDNINNAYNAEAQSREKIRALGQDRFFDKINLGFKIPSKQISGGYIHEPMNLEYNRSIIQQIEAEANGRSHRERSSYKKESYSYRHRPFNPDTLQMGTSLEKLTEQQTQSRNGYAPAEVKTHRVSNIPKDQQIIQQTISKKYMSSSNAEAQDSTNHSKGPVQRKQRPSFRQKKLLIQNVGSVNGQAKQSQAHRSGLQEQN